MLEPNTDIVLARDLARQQAPADRDEDEFERWLAGQTEETREVLRVLEKTGLDLWASFWVAREVGWL